MKDIRDKGTLGFHWFPTSFRPDFLSYYFSFVFVAVVVEEF